MPALRTVLGPTIRSSYSRSTLGNPGTGGTGLELPREAAVRYVLAARQPVGCVLAPL